MTNQFDLRRFLFPSTAVVEPQLYHCRFQDLQIAPNSVSLICTDIPYGKHFLPQLDDLAAFAERVLLPGGLMVSYSGQYYFPRVLQSLGQCLIYRWIIKSGWDGAATIVHPLNLLNKWKPIVVFSKGGWSKRGRWLDVVSGPKNKRWHPHQQSLEEVETLVRYYSKPGELVVDPCGGSMTTAVACRNLSRRCIACDVDLKAVDIGRQRLRAGSK